MGGGGGGNRSFGKSGTIKNLEREAKVELAKAKEARRSAFISFANEDLNEVNLLRGHALNDNSEIDFIDRSLHEPIDSERAPYIKQKITEKIRQASVTIVYLSDSTASSQWVAWEIEKSLELGKQVIAIHSGDSRPSTIPSAVTQNKIKIVPWSKLADTLNKL